MTTVPTGLLTTDTAEPPASDTPAPTVPLARTHLALGYLGFSATLFFLSLFHTALVPFEFITAVFPMAIFFGGVAQFTAGIWAHQRRDHFAAVLFTSFAAFWLSYSLYTWRLLPPLVAEYGNAVTAATGSFTLAWGVLALFFTVAARAVDRATFALMALAAAMFAGITAGQYAVAPAIDLVGGVFALITAVLGLYIGAAHLINGGRDRVLLPLGPGSR
ncbi:hypothetical protein GCM10009799_51700 [Nocardiopsis rhodophaea]|uniref:Uncharacterized protein n=1 Tax=Nocardiopsis rhodophaea TaxID=280238 RepID=A0ABP5F6X7_9ACTN